MLAVKRTAPEWRTTELASVVRCIRLEAAILERRVRLGARNSSTKGITGYGNGVVAKDGGSNEEIGVLHCDSSSGEQSCVSLEDTVLDRSHGVADKSSASISVSTLLVSVSESQSSNRESGRSIDVQAFDDGPAVQTFDDRELGAAGSLEGDPFREV